MVFMMDELLALRRGMVVFEVGTGSGYHAATIAEVVAPTGENPTEWGHVYTAEIIPSLARWAWKNLKKTGYSDRVSVLAHDGSAGLPLRIRPDRILITAAAPKPPEPLLEQLKVGGRMVLPVGEPTWWGGQVLAVIDKEEEGEYKTTAITEVAFVPLRGKYGWPG